MPRKIFKQNVIAIVYDFDGTLSPQPMQEYTVLPQIGIQPKEFWREVKKVAKETVSEEMLVYMRLLLEKADQNQVHFGRKDFRALASQIQYFPGVDTWFDRINEFVRSIGKKIKVRHYLISAGLKEILEGISIRKHFHNIFASEYFFDHHDVAKFPNLLITDTTKTQFLFRINKGKEKLTDNINHHMPEYMRPIPYSNIIYIGDGLTDVPSMTVTKHNGGNTVAVYKKGSNKQIQVCRSLLEAKRVHFIARADYSGNSILEKRVHLLLRSIVSSIEYNRELFKCRRDHNMLA
jgi:hypothetical protein